jgi:hypothetical protein
MRSLDHVVSEVGDRCTTPLLRGYPHGQADYGVGRTSGSLIKMV